MERLFTKKDKVKMKKITAAIMILFFLSCRSYAGEGFSVWEKLGVGTIADDDMFGITDASDTTQSLAGSSKTVTAAQIKAYVNPFSGDCTGTPCLDGTADGGNLIKLWAGTGSYWTALQGGAPAANRSWRLPIDAAPSAGTTRLMNMDEYGQMGFIDPAGFVADTGDETIAGVKTFSSSPILPTPTSDMQGATKKYVDDNAGSGTFDGDASDVPVTDAGTFFTTDTVEAALQQLGTFLKTTFTGTLLSGITSHQAAVQAIATAVDGSIELGVDGTTIEQYGTTPNINLRVKSGVFESADSSIVKQAEIDSQAKFEALAGWSLPTGGTGAINITTALPDTPGEANLNDTTHVLTVASLTGLTAYAHTTFTAWDTTPAAFSFTDQTDVALSSTMTSAAIEVAGINYPAAITVTGGTYDINASGTFVSTEGTVSVGDDIRARHTSSASNSTATNTVVTIGGVSDTFTSTTEASGGFSGTLQWLATSATLADYPADLVITPGGGATVGVNNGEQSGNVNAYDRWFKIAYAAGLIDPLLGRATIKVYPTAVGKYVLNLGNANGSFYLSYNADGKFAYGYRYAELVSTNTYALNTWHTVTLWWDSANDDIGMTVNSDTEVTNTDVSGSDLASTWTTLYLGIINEGATGCGYITDFEVWDNKEGN